MRRIVLVLFLIYALSLGISAQERNGDLFIKLTGSYIMPFGPDYSSVDKFTVPVLYGGMKGIISINAAANYKLKENRYIGLELGYEKSNNWIIKGEDLYNGTKILNYNISPYLDFQRPINKKFASKGFMYIDLGLNLMVSSIYLTNFNEFDPLPVEGNRIRKELLISPGTFVQGGIIYLINQDVGFVLESRLFANLISSNITNEKIFLRSEIRIGLVFEILKSKSIL